MSVTPFAPRGTLASALPAPLGPYASHLPAALEDVAVPCFVLDRSGRIVWINAAGKAVVGDVVGRFFTSVVDPDDVRAAKARFERRLAGEQLDDVAIDLRGASGGEVTVEISSVRLGSTHHAVGLFGIAVPAARGAAAPKLDGRLTERQREVLHHLGQGASTEQIADHLVITRETARNHVRHVLGRLGARSRLEAVAIAHRDGLLAG